MALRIESGDGGFFASFSCWVWERATPLRSACAHRDLLLGTGDKGETQPPAGPQALDARCSHLLGFCPLRS